MRTSGPESSNHQLCCRGEKTRLRTVTVERWRRRARLPQQRKRQSTGGCPTSQGSNLHQARLTCNRYLYRQRFLSVRRFFPVTLPGFANLTLVRHTEITVPADILLTKGTYINNEAMLSGESTSLLKELIELLDGSEKLDVDSVHKNEMLFSGTKVLHARSGESIPDGGCLRIAQRTGFGTSQG